MYLFCGDHPNLKFYHWKLSQSTPNVFVYSPNGELGNNNNNVIISNKKSKTIWNTADGQSHSVPPPQILSDLNRVSNLQMVFLSASSLQDLASLCGQLGGIIQQQQQQQQQRHVTVVVESTNFVNLEPFVKMSMQLDESQASIVDVYSIMSDYDIRCHESFMEVCPSKKESELIYVGRSGKEKVYTEQDVNNINLIASLFENCGLDVYKLNTPLEFLSYQWKFALPKIAIEPLSILFEQPFPQDLSDQILSKPLISGLVSEVITIIKTMGCKLFNSYDNENSLITRLNQLNPPVELSKDQREAPKLYYDFYNGYSLYLDLLLLQPILIADDHQVKTPYLEFLYAVMSQMASFNNSSWGDLRSSSFWIRKREVERVLDKSNREVNDLKAQLDVLNNELESTRNQLKQQNQQQQQQQQQVHQVQQQPVQYQVQQQAKQIKQTAPIPAMSAPNQRYDQIKRSSTDPQIDLEMEELSELAANYSITQQTPQLGQPFEHHQNNNNNHQQQQVQPVVQSQSQNPISHSINGGNSPQFSPQQGLPHGLPPQGLPMNGGNLGFSSSPPGGFSNAYNGPPYGNGYPAPNPGPGPGPGPNPGLHKMASNPQFGYQGGMYNGGPPPSNGLYNGGGINNGSRRSLHQGSDYGRFDTSYGSIPSSRSQQFGPGPGPGPNGFKPTSRKNNNRMSQNIMAQQYTGGPSGGANGMRHSMMPMTMPVPRRSTAPGQLPNGNQNGSGSQNDMVAPGSTPAAPPAPPSAMMKSTSASQLSLSRPAQSDNLVPVPEATPSPTPVYVTSGIEEKPKKKKGLFKFKKSS